MLAATALTALLGVAAWTLDVALRAVGRQGRAPWGVAVVASVAWPVVASLAAGAPAQTVAVRVLTANSLALSAAPDAPVDLVSAMLARLALLDRPLLTLWMVASLLLAGRVLWAVAVLRRTAQRAPRTRLDGSDVHITPALGPAVFALWRAHVLLPSWMLELDAPLRALVLAHEREHVSARDAQFIIASHIATALMPWNVPLWWVAKRLRVAAELDCDARVLRQGVDAGAYSHLLLLIAQRQGHARFLPMMAGAPSTLRARIIAMSTPRPARPALRAALFTIAASALVALTASPVLARPLASTSLAETVMALLQTPQQPAQPSTQQPSRGKPTTQPPLQQPSQKRPATQPPLAAKPAPKEFKEFKLDKPAVPASGFAAPRYPEILKSAGVTGSTLVMFVVDTSGLVDASTFKVVRTAHQLFANAVKASLGGMKFLPAEAGNRPVRQLVQGLYRFVTTSRPQADTVTLVKDVTSFEVTITAVDQPGGGPDGGPVLAFRSGPLYIVDGARTAVADVRKLDEERIASVEVLKGDAARAKYGDDGRNGVVIITLKK
jgi:beta-lactamase regulating signal transducer with metallopeptidase domain